MEGPEEIVKKLLHLAPHLEVAHHVPGRIRLRIRASGLGLVLHYNVDDVMRNIPGVTGIRINAPAKSVVIEYNERHLPVSLWKNVEKVRERPELINTIAAQLRSLWESKDGMTPA